jgi:outer membrane lipoprotein-sorting protein
MKNTWIIVPLILAQLAYSQKAEDIIRTSEDRIKGKSCYGIFAMTVTTPDYTRKMEMESWWVGNDKALIVIKSPKKEAGNKSLKIKNEMWSYLKNTETTIKLPPSMMLQSWNGSDFTNDDLVRESNLNEDYTQKIVGQEIVQGEQCWRIELLPKPTAPVVWGRLLYWVRQTDYLPATVEYFDEKGRLMRSMVYSDFKILGGRILPARWEMVNKVKPGHSTIFELVNVKFDIPISDKIFSFRELEKR